MIFFLFFSFSLAHWSQIPLLVVASDKIIKRIVRNLLLLTIICMLLFDYMCHVLHTNYVLVREREGIIHCGLKMTRAVLA